MQARLYSPRPPDLLALISLLICVVQDLQSILSHVLNDEDQKVKDSFPDTLPEDRSPISSVCFNKQT